MTENRELSLTWINYAVKQSAKLLESGEHTEEQHKLIFDWAKPFLEESQEDDKNQETDS